MLNVVFWGTGQDSDYYMKYVHSLLAAHIKITAFVDSNADKKSFYGYSVYLPTEVCRLHFDKLVIMTRLYQEEIAEQIAREGLVDKGQVLLHKNFYREVVRIFLENRTNVCFLGDRGTYKRMFYRAKILFEEHDFKDDVSNLDNRYDAYFLCPPMLEKREDVIRDYEQNLMSELCNVGISKTDIFSSILWQRFFFRDIETSFGDENQNKTIYIVTINAHYAGWGILLWNVLASIKYAEKQNMIPVVDMKYVPNLYIDDEDLGKFNAWDRYFCPISSIDIETAYKSKNVIISSGSPPFEAEECDGSQIILRNEIQEEIESFVRSKFPKEKVLGVIYRGTDYNNNVVGHPLPIKIDDFIQIVKDKLQEIGYRYVFLATEVFEAVEAFQSAFGDYLIYMEQLRFHANETRWLADIHSARENDTYLRGKEYLKVLYLLAQCDSLLGQHNAAFIIAPVLKNGKYEHIFKL
ncbi:MAG: hypothetical protein J6M62_03910 [Selenomonadaceae bacterium]|nr:hypothetical protein [Selenomonadaceae bacterium]